MIAEGIRVLALAREWRAVTDLAVNGGTYVVDSGRYLPTPEGAQRYRSGVYRPRDDWRRVTKTERDLLLGITGKDDLHNTVILLDAPGELLHRAWDMRLDAMTRSRAEHQEGKRHALPFLIACVSEWLVEKVFQPFELCSAEVNFTHPPRVSTTYDSEQGRDRGLHVDNWGHPRRMPQERGAAGIRVGVNLGRESRAFVFVNLGLSECAEALREEPLDNHLATALADRNASALAECFLDRNPGYSVTRVVLRPGQAYIAPVQNIVHDGYTAGRRTLDVNLQLSSNHFVHREEFDARAVQVKRRTRPARTTGTRRYGPLQLLIVQGTPLCNIDCDYCYLPDRTVHRPMSLGTFQQTLNRVAEADLVEREFTVVWHAGEPLVMGREFYESAWELSRECARQGGFTITHSIQTNGLLVDSRWCELFTRLGFRVGLSIDGPAHIHDSNRRSRAGRGTHARVMRAVRLLQEHKVPFSLIAVVSSAMLPYPEEFADFFVANGIPEIGFNIEEREGVNTSSSLEGHEEEYRVFLRTLYRAARERNLRIREFNTAEQHILFASGVRSAQATPFQLLNVDSGGAFSTFSPELLGHRHPQHGEFTIGNVWKDSIRDAMKSDRFRALLAEIDEGVRLCGASCRYFPLCGGGAPSNKWFENDTFASTETLECRLTKQAVIDVVLDGITQDLR
ncbi:cyclophane-forming radical SAM/SPASM peptide maturase GrrM/OscB [Actinomadura alba]|uniref:GRRM system radical SAM/SPASM domain protein n=1 Tax=Actinomadura alba TaxID=406431 RepID=A0ABR7LSD9_9ACTN|nr:cyclophane-forming radical SAM/SPASM peptide maturase GrrM/OscB [Actinomadura alba]MBC6467761.1 GRRM system radical SAM/SPASM domain protein [Actinomadura alba]